MSKTVETVDGKSYLNPLYEHQKQDVANMRTSLLACHLDPSLATSSMKQIAVMRVYHQISRIIQYTEMMDKIEAKMYESINYAIDNMDVTRNTSWITLLNIQEKLIKNMVESQKLLQPFLDLTQFDMSEVVSDNGPTNTISLDVNKREKLRSSARQVLQELNVG